MGTQGQLDMFYGDDLELALAHYRQHMLPIVDFLLQLQRTQKDILRYIPNQGSFRDLAVNLTKYNMTQNNNKGIELLLFLTEQPTPSTLIRTIQTKVLDHELLMIIFIDIYYSQSFVTPQIPHNLNKDEHKRQNVTMYFGGDRNGPRSSY